MRERLICITGERNRDADKRQMWKFIREPFLGCEWNKIPPATSVIEPVYTPMLQLTPWQFEGRSPNRLFPIHLQKAYRLTEISICLGDIGALGYNSDLPKTVYGLAEKSGGFRRIPFRWFIIWLKQKSWLIVQNGFKQTLYTLENRLQRHKVKTWEGIQVLFWVNKQWKPNLVRFSQTSKVFWYTPRIEDSGI